MKDSRWQWWELWILALALIAGATAFVVLTITRLDLKSTALTT